MSEYKNSELIDELITNLFFQIFDNNSIEQLSNLEKRSKIYGYLIENIQYDYRLLESRKRKGRVNNYQEI